MNKINATDLNATKKTSRTVQSKLFSSKILCDMKIREQKNLSRRKFITTTAASLGAVVVGFPAIATASKTDSKILLGEGDHVYEVEHQWAKLPAKYSWQTTHNVAMDKAGLLYVIHEGHANKPEHPAIFVFDAEGKYVRSFGKEFQGGGHGLEIREENGEEFLYVCAYQKLKNISKLSLKGERVWKQKAPMQSGVYAKDEATNNPAKVWGRDRFLPTNIAFLPDGGFLVADGYGSYYIHRYDNNAKWVSKFGGPSHKKENGKFSLPHGIWIDSRNPKEHRIVVADRVNGRLQWFSFEGKHKQTLDSFLLPANIDIREDVMLVPDLQARITLLDKQNRVIKHLGEDPKWRAEINKDPRLRTQPKRWRAGRFIHPHDACFDTNGNIFVAEWVQPGRITKLRKQN